MKKSILVICACFLFNVHVQAKMVNTKQVSETAINQLLKAINSDDYKEISHYVSSHVSEEAINRIGGQANYAHYLSAESHFHGKLTFQSLESAKLINGYITSNALAYSENTELNYRVRLSLTQQKPHQLAYIRLLPSEVPTVNKHLNAAAEINKYINRVSSKGTFSGRVLIAKNGQVLVNRAVGLTNKQFQVPVNLETAFNLGSMNKMFTSTAILKLVQQKQLSLTASLEDVLGLQGQSPWFKDIQIQHLLSHTSGLGRFQCEAGDNFTAKSSSECFNLLAGANVQFKPGSRYRYSNEGMFTLGLILEKITGKSYETVMTELITTPAEMTQTHCADIQFPRHNVATGYFYSGKHQRFGNNLSIHAKRCSPAGGYYASAKDLLKFSDALRNNQLLNSDLTAKALTAKPELGAQRYGFGFSVREQNGKRVVGHNGAFPGVSAQMDIHLDTGYTVIVLSNHSFAADPVINKINHLFKL